MNMQIWNLYSNTWTLEATDEYHLRNLFIATEFYICSDGFVFQFVLLLMSYSSILLTTYKNLMLITFGQYQQVQNCKNWDKCKYHSAVGFSELEN